MFKWLRREKPIHITICDRDTLQVIEFCQMVRDKYNIYAFLHTNFTAWSNGDNLTNFKLNVENMEPLTATTIQSIARLLPAMLCLLDARQTYKTERNK